MSQPKGAEPASAEGPQTYALDASALLCLIDDEPGSERVAAALSSAVISAVNLAEVASELSDLGADAEAARALLAPLHLSIVPLDGRAVHATGALRSAIRQPELSLGDQACLGPWRESLRDSSDHGQGLRLR